MQSSLSDRLANRLNKSHSFIGDYGMWISCLESRPECTLYRRAISEYQFALLASVLGLYRQAFTSLRLCLELSLAGAYFSANELQLREWFRGDQDIRWASLKDHENGVFSTRFVRAFYEQLVDIAPQYGETAEKIYRECSEYVHGNSFTHDLLSGRLEFNENVFIDWHGKAQQIHSIIIFVLCVRYLSDLNTTIRNKLEPVILDEVGHISEIRILFENQG